MNVGYFKRFHEGGAVPVARPQNRGGNVIFESDAPVFMTAAQEVSLWRGRRLDQYETAQASVRIKYYHLTHTYAEADRVDCPPCGHCGARVWLEPLVENASSLPAADSAPPVAAIDAAGGGSGRVVRRRLTGKRAPRARASEVVATLAALVELKEKGCVDDAQCEMLRAGVLRGV